MEFVKAKTILSKVKYGSDWYGIDYNMNLYRGCSHGCIYCDSRSNCYYLDILRWFRDNFVSKEDKKEYYEVAPKVVETLDSLDNANEVYNQIYTKVIQVCVRLIEYGRYDEAYEIYKDNVLDLQNKFVRKLVPSQ